MFDISPEKILVFLVIAFLVLGPGRLGEVARALGRARAQLRQWSDGLSPETAKLIRNPRGAILDVLDEPRQAMADTADATREAMLPRTKTPIPQTPVTQTPVTQTTTTGHEHEEVTR